MANNYRPYLLAANKLGIARHYYDVAITVKVERVISNRSMSSLKFKLTDGDEVGVVVHILNSFDGPSLLLSRWALNNINANQGKRI